MKTTYKLFSFNFSIIFFLFLLSGCGSESSVVTPDADQKVLLISIDGFMNQYIDRNPTPNFDQMIANGTKAEHLIPVFPTKTFPNHYSQVTGLLAENHGIISNSFPDDSLGGRFSYGPPDGSSNDNSGGGESRSGLQLSFRVKPPQLCSGQVLKRQSTVCSLQNGSSMMARLITMQESIQ